METYKEVFADKELYVVALEAFPTESLQPMYSFYPNHYFHINQPVYELLHMPAVERERLVDRQEKAVMWMPNCTPEKMEKWAQLLEHNMSIFGHLHSTCFIIPAGPNRRTVDPQQQAEYIKRFKQHQKYLIEKYAKN